MRYQNFKPISVALRKPAQKIGGKKGFRDQTLIVHWQDYVGEEIASLCQPKEIRSNRGRGATLVLNCVSARASELTMRSEEIRARINAGLGFDAIAKILLNHQHVDYIKKSLPASQPRVEIREVPAAMTQKLAETESEELRSALQAIIYSFYHKESDNK